ncbi:MAG: signal peptidase I [Thiotrichales bacterium]|nr:signal peptidase I [Thiotrichales bacterium]
MVKDYFGFKKVSAFSYTLFGVLFVLVAMVYYSFNEKYKFAVNLSESLPQSVFIVDKKPVKDVQRMDLVEFEYISQSGKMAFDDGSVFVKYIGGVPGDRIDFTSNQVFINGLPLAMLKEKSSKGLDLEPNKPRVLGDDEYFVYTPHPDSFDSRYAYVGYVKKSQLIGKVRFSI